MAHRSISSGRWLAPAPRVAPIRERTAVPILGRAVVPIPAPKAQAGPGSRESPVAEPKGPVLIRPGRQARAQVADAAEAEAEAQQHPQAAEAEAEAQQHPQAAAEAEAHPQAAAEAEAHPQAAAEAEAHPQARSSICTSNRDDYCPNRRVIAIRGADDGYSGAVTNVTTNTGISRPALRSYIA
jgi:hypothetical protein